jgi:hypothetical protein
LESAGHADTFYKNEISTNPRRLHHITGIESWYW